MAHPLDIPENVRDMVQGRLGKTHAYDRLDPKKTALVVVDMQNYFMKDGFPACCPSAREIVPTVNDLASELRAAGGQVVWIVTEALPEDANDWANLYQMMGAKAGAARYAGLERESEGYELWPEMDAKPGDETVVKTRYSAMIEGSSNLHKVLKEKGIDTVLITGVATNVCCEATARDAMMLGYRTVMVHDANATFSDAEHNASLATFYKQFGDVQSAEETKAFLAAGATEAAG